MSMRKKQDRPPDSSQQLSKMTKSSQKRLRNEDEESEDVLPSSKRQECFFSSCPYQCQGAQGSVEAGNPHKTQGAATSSAHEGCPHVRQNSADITMALHNTHLSGQHHHPQLSSLPPYQNSHHQQQHQQQLQHQQHHLLQEHQKHLQEQYQQQPYLDHPSLLKDAGVPRPLPQNALGPLPDVVHETSEEDYYCHVNRMLRSAHFERLKRVGGPETGHHSAAFSGDSHL